MAVAKISTQTPRANPRETGSGEPSPARKGKEGVNAVADKDDYNGMPLEQWKAELKKDVEERIGPTPTNLTATGEAGW